MNLPHRAAPTPVRRVAPIAILLLVATSAGGACPVDPPGWSASCRGLFGAAPADPAGDVLCAAKDSRLMEAHRNNNTGIEEASVFKIGNGRDRVIVGFALDPVAMPASSVRRVRLRLAIWANGRGTQFTSTGLDVGTYPVRAHWEEGNGRWDRFLDRPPTDPISGHFGRGATWSCAVDQAIENGSNGRDASECDPARFWNGGGIDDDPATPQDETVQPTATCRHPARKRDVPLTIEPCYAANVWSFTCDIGSGEAAYDVRTVVDFAEWDVTGDVKDALAAQQTEVSWILRKNPSRSTRGRLRYFSKEGAQYWIDKGVAGAAALAPHLFVERE